MDDSPANEDGFSLLKENEILLKIHVRFKN